MEGIGLIAKVERKRETVVLKVGMSCQGCVGAVRRVLTKMEGVESFDVDIEKQKVTVKGNVKPDAVLQTVSKTGKKTSFWEEEPEAKEAPALALAPAAAAAAAATAGSAPTVAATDDSASTTATTGEDSAPAPATTTTA